MGNRTAKFISTIFASIIAGAPFAAVSQNAPSAPRAATSTANAASDCLASPKGVAPQGQHWFYRLERSTKRQCWYLRAGGAKDSAKAVQTAQAAPDTTATDTAAPPPQHSVQDARAEYVTPQNVAAPKALVQAAPVPAQQPAAAAADTSAQQPAVTTRWPDATAAAPAPQAAPVQQPPVAAAPPVAKPAKSPAPVTLAAADTTSDKPAGSLQTLMLVVGGALALAGLLASIVYRFAGGRVRVQAQGHAHDNRRVNWDHREAHDLDDSRAPWLNETPSARQGPIDFDAERAQIVRPEAPQIAAFSSEIGRIAALSRSTHHEAAELDEADIFDGAFEIEASAPRLAAGEAHDDEAVDEQPAGHDDDERIEDVQIDKVKIDDLKIDDTVDVDVITAMLERLAQEGPRLRQSTLEADLAELARSSRAQSAARA